MQKHQWREQTEEGLRFFRAQYHGGRWTLLTRLKEEEFWETKEELGRADWEKLREVLFNKYQRRRCPWELVEKIDRRLEALSGKDDD